MCPQCVPKLLLPDWHYLMKTGVSVIQYYSVENLLLLLYKEWANENRVKYTDLRDLKLPQECEHPCEYALPRALPMMAEQDAVEFVEWLREICTCVRTGGHHDNTFCIFHHQFLEYHIACYKAARLDEHIEVGLIQKNSNCVCETRNDPFHTSTGQSCVWWADL